MALKNARVFQAFQTLWLSALLLTGCRIFADEPPTSWVDPAHRPSRHPPHARARFRQLLFQRQWLYVRREEDGLHHHHNFGISVLNLDTLQATQLVTGRVRAIIVAPKSSDLYYTRETDNPLYRSLWCVNLDTGANRRVADLPRRASVS